MITNTRSSQRLAGIIALVVFPSLPCPGLVLRAFSGSAHLRINNFPSNPTVNPTFLNPGGGASTLLDLTGVGWSVQDPTKQLTLVSPRHFVGANHFRPAVGSQVRFLAKDQTLHILTIARISAVPNGDGTASDVFLGEFTGDLPAAAPVLALPYLNLPTEGGYVGQQLVVAGKAARGGRGTIGSVSDFGGDPLTSGAGITTRAFTFSYGPFGGVDDAYAEAGDSGSPSLVVRSGRAALVGTHTAVLSALGTTTTYDTLVPHYVPELNALMEPTGLHMRKSDPAATSFSASGAAVEMKVRAGKPFSYRVAVTNGSNLAENVVADFTQAPGTGISGVLANGWFAPGSLTVRRGGLAAGATSEIDLSFAASESGEIQIALRLKSDGSAEQVFAFPLTVLPSFAEWAAGLGDATPTGDSDGDGISNLVEYASGGDNRVNSRFFAGDPEQGLLPVLTLTPGSLSFIRRRDAADRGLSYVIESSTTLDSGDWQVIQGEPAVNSALSPEFEKVSTSLPAAGDKAFYRLRIGLTE